MKLLLGILLPVLFISFLLLNNGKLHLFSWNFHPSNLINGFLNDQSLGLILGLLIVIITLLINPEAREFLYFGNTSNFPEAVKFFGIKNTDTWTKTAFQMGAVISIATFCFMYFSNKQSFNWNIIAQNIGWILLFSASNALAEELICRFGIVGMLKGSIAPTSIFLISALIFGLPHYFGNPSGIIGVVMAGILGFVLSKATYETGGLGIAFIIHFIQDIIIFSSLFSLQLKSS